MAETRRSYRWLALALILAAARSLPNLSYPLGRDQATYAVVGRGLLRGARLYRDIWDVKPPAIFWTYAGIVKAFGSVMWSVGVVDVLWMLAMAWCIFRFAERYVGPSAGVIAVLVEASWHSRIGYINAAQPETFLILFVFLAYFQIWRERRHVVLRHLAAGVLFGAAFWFKYNALALLPFLVLVPYLDLAALHASPRRLRLTLPWGEWLKRTGVVLAGFAASLAAVLGYFVLAGLWSAMWQSHFLMVSRYGASPLANLRNNWLTPVAATVLFLGFLTVLALLAGFIVAWKSRELGRFAPVLLGAAFGYGSAAMQVRFPSFGFEPCYPFFAMSWGYVAVKAFQWARGFGREKVPERGKESPKGEHREKAPPAWSPARILVWFVLANAVFWPAFLDFGRLARGYHRLAECRADPDTFYANYPDQYRLEHLGGEMQVIHYIQANARPRDGVYVWGAAALIYFLTDQPSPTRFVPNFPLVAVWGPQAWRDELVRDLRNSPPGFIVLARHDVLYPVTFTWLDSAEYVKRFPALDALISGSYQQVADFPDFVVYRRTSSR